jgi:hypothetical protein
MWLLVMLTGSVLRGLVDLLPQPRPGMDSHNQLKTVTVLTLHPLLAAVAAVALCSQAACLSPGDLKQQPTEWGCLRSEWLASMIVMCANTC